MWALILLNFGVSFAQSFQLNSLPTYYNDILGFPVAETAMIFAGSSLIRLVTGPSFSFLGDYLIKRDKMGQTTQRKYFCIFCEYSGKSKAILIDYQSPFPFLTAHMIPGIIMVGMCFLTGHPILSAALDVFNNAIMGSINLTANQNSQDLSPNFASSIYGIVNFTGSIGGLATLYILAMLVNINVSTSTSTHRDLWIKFLL